MLNVRLDSLKGSQREYSSAVVYVYTVYDRLVHSPSLLFYYIIVAEDRFEEFSDPRVGQPRRMRCASTSRSRLVVSLE